MKATVLVDNIASDGLPGEWGLSIYIEYEGEQILVDAGASGKFAQNAEKLGLDLAKVKFATLSHAHYDHANGMETFFRANPGAPFYLRKDAAENCYKKIGFFKKYIGIPKHILRDREDRIRFAEGDTQLMDGVWLIPHKTPNLAALGKREKMLRRVDHRWITDDFAHEQSLVFDTPAGLVIFNCCCHGGAANIIEEVAATFPEKKVYALIGGFHLYNKTEEEIRALAAKVRETGIEYLCTGHCTGQRAYKILEEELGEKLHQLHTGLVMEFPEVPNIPNSPNSPDSPSSPNSD